MIWPVIAGRPSIADSARGVINVIDTTTTGLELRTPSEPRIYMSGSNLIIKGCENVFGDIRIYNVEGRLMESGKIPESISKPMGQYATGLYLVEFIMTDGSRKVYKVFNSSQQ